MVSAPLFQKPPASETSTTTSRLKTSKTPLLLNTNNRHSPKKQPFIQRDIMKKTRKYIFAAALLSGMLLIGGCKGKQDAEASGKASPMREAHEKYIANLTANDTTEVLALCKNFLSSLHEGNFDEAVAGIYQLDSVGTPQRLGDAEIASLRRRTTLFPVVSYKFEDMTFFMPDENTVTFNVAFNSDTPPATMGWGFRPVLIDGKWYLTFL